MGAGFGGLSAARRLLDARDFEITLIDSRNHHLFQPLLYQVAMAGLSPADVATPIRAIFRRAQNLKVYLDEVVRVDWQERAVVGSSKNIYKYDYLLLACGASHSYFGHDEWEQFAPGLKTIEQAIDIRRRVLLAFEQAEREQDPALRREFLTFVVIGGGPTGVELAGSLAEISRHTLSQDLRNIDPSQARIILLEAGPRILSQFSLASSRRAAAGLERFGVTIWTAARVTEISEHGVRLGNESVRARTVLWAAGVRPAPVTSTLEVALDPLGRVIVGQDLRPPGHPEVFVIGDMARFEQDGSALPGVAPVAMQQGRFVAGWLIKNKNHLPAEAPLQAFRYRDKGLLATIGRASAVAEFGRLRLGGFWAWLLWLVVHIYYLIGFRNRVLVLLQWAWSYFTYSRGPRLIVTKS